MLYLNVLPLFLKQTGLCFIPDVITMFSEFGGVALFYVTERCGVAVWFLYLVLKSFSVSPMHAQKCCGPYV